MKNSANLDEDAGRTTSWKIFLSSEAGSGLLLMAAAAAGLIMVNGSEGWAGAYDAMLSARVGSLSLHHWINDGLMALFFLVVGLEIKREAMHGALASPADRRLPLIVAAVGMGLPAALFFGVVGHSAELRAGWAIPAATDIAFALGVMALAGRGVPLALKLLLTSIAIADDLGAILIIAIAYSGGMDGLALGLAGLIVLIMVGANRLGLRILSVWLLLFVLLWAALLKSGLHATLAGVVTAFIIPLDPSGQRLEHRLLPWSSWLIVPLFGFANAGVRLADGQFGLLALAVAVGLFLGKQVAVFGGIWAVDRLGIARRPEGAGWGQIYGMAVLCGVGFTMSLFIGALAFPGSPELVEQAKIGTLAGSLFSAVVGWAVLSWTRDRS